MPAPDRGYAYALAEEQWDFWASEGLTNEAMVTAVTGWTVRSASKVVAIDVIANAWLQSETAARAAAVDDCSTEPARALSARPADAPANGVSFPV